MHFSRALVDLRIAAFGGEQRLYLRAAWPAKQSGIEAGRREIHMNHVQAP
jgi:hypothetical protein